MRRATTALLAGLLTAGGLAALAPSASAAATPTTGPITPRDLTITVTNLGPEHRTCQIDADLYIPHGVDAAHPAPAILATNGFGGDKTDQEKLAQGFGEQGYVTLSYTGLGFIDGDACPITLDDREHDGNAAGQLVRFLGGDPSVVAVDDATKQRVYVNQVRRQDATSHLRYDPVVGMTGGSYGGQIQFAAAAWEKEHGGNRLDAINPIITWNDLSYSLDPNDGTIPGGTARSGSVSSNVPGSFKFEWSLFFSGEGFADGVPDLPALAKDPAALRAYVAAHCVNFSSQVCTALTEVLVQGYPSQQSISFLRHASVASYMGDVRIPTFLMQGQADTLFNLQESVATYTKLEAQGTPAALEWQSWGHSDSTPVPGELDQRHPADSYQGRQLIAWFGYYLEHQGSQPPLGFSYFRDWVYATTKQATADDVAKAYTSGPLPGGKTRTWYLSGTSGPDGQTTPNGISTGGGDLVTSPSAVVPGTSAYSSVAPIGPNYSETSAVESSLDPEPKPSDPLGTSVRFLTAPLPCALDVVGSPQLTVKLDAPSVALTQSQGPGGMLVVYAKVYDVGPDGAVELPHRLIAPVRVADVTKPVTVELPGIVHQFAAGHRLAIVLAGGDLAYRGSTSPQPVTLTTGGSTDHLVVPLA